MLRAALAGFGITLLLLLIPIVHFVTAVPSPFIGGFIGGSRAQAQPGQAVGIGLLMGLFMAAPVLVVGAVVGLIVGGSDAMALILGIAGLVVIYVSVLGSLGALWGGHIARRQG